MLTCPHHIQWVRQVPGGLHQCILCFQVVTKKDVYPKLEDLPEEFRRRWDAHEATRPAPAPGEPSGAPAAHPKPATVAASRDPARPGAARPAPHALEARPAGALVDRPGPASATPPPAAPPSAPGPRPAANGDEKADGGASAASPHPPQPPAGG